jgi:tetratricopeptide (TPR) repeat protein
MRSRRAVPAACAVALFALLARPSAAAVRLAFEIDPRVEVMSAALMLSDSGGVDDEYSRDARAAFATLKDHPAVARLAALRARGVSPAAIARLMLELSAPPALAAPRPLSEETLAALGGRDATDALLAELRDFSRRSRFQDFYDKHRQAYSGFVDAAKKEALHAISPEAAEAYLGAPFSGEHRFVLAPLLSLGGAQDEVLTRHDGDSESFLRPRGRGNGGASGFLFDTFERSAAHALCFSSFDWIRPPSPEMQTRLADAVELRVLAQDLGEPAYVEALRRPPFDRRPQLKAVAESLKAFESARPSARTLREFYPRLDAPARARTAGRLDAAASDAEALIRLARSYQDKGEFARALEPLEALIAGSPGDAGLRLDRASAAAHAGQREKALASLADARRLAPDREGRHRMALILQDLKDYQGALDLLGPLADEKPEASLLADLGLCRFLAGRPEQAISDLKAAIALDPRALAPYLTLAAIYAGRNELDKELGVYAAAPAGTGDPALREQLLRGREAAEARARNGRR